MKVVTLVIFFLITPIYLISSIATLYIISKHQLKSEQLSTEEKPKADILASQIPVKSQTMSGVVFGSDIRVSLLERYMRRNNSVLTAFAEKIVQTSDKYGLDYRLLVAIAQKESGLCRVIPENSHNCWGWGIHSKGTLKFSSYDVAIETVAKGLKEKYIDLGYTTPELIMKKYAHPNSTTWADGVNMYMQKIEEPLYYQ
ncbi:MAG: hypothetical protein NZM26_02525 [Patescibacteria group bacterium]|nr:hypothetical protein [Patescibacteria group bacterium]